MNVNLKAIINASEIATPTGNKAICGHDMSSIKSIKNGGIIIDGNKIVFVGTMDEVKAHDLYHEIPAENIIDAGGKLVTPGYVDSHTHFVFGGNRADEYNMRLAGATYMEIMEAGGGIQASVNATREISFDDLYARSKTVLERIFSLGVTTIEGKSGYGLNEETELKQLNVMKKLDEELPIDIVKTYMGAHSVPKEMKGRGREYLKTLEPTMQKVLDEDLAEFCDIFCEDKVFSIDESREYLNVAKKMGFKLKMHADEIVDLGGGKLAAEVGAVSADHLLMASDESLSAMRDAGVVANLLPLTAFSLREHYVEARKLIDMGLAVSIGTDYNPGSCPSYSMPLLIAISTLNMKMSVKEVLTAITLNAAAAIDRADEIGSIESGKKADILIHEIQKLSELAYNLGLPTVSTVIKNGEVV